MKKLTLLLLFLAACSSSDKQPGNAYRRAGDQPLVDDKYSLQADRKELDEVRSQISADKKKQNDELAFSLGLMSEVKKPPMEIRSQFDGALRKKRDLFDRDMQKERESFTKDERRKREAFLKNQQQQRDQFGREKHSRDEKNDFYKELDEKRSDYFSVERDRRNDFESDVRERRRSFEDYVREKQNEFNQEHKAYTKRYEEMKKEQREQANPSSPSKASFNSEAADLDRELESLKSKPGTNLESGE
jgi:hypothetical protein